MKTKLNYLSKFALVAMAFSLFLVSCEKEEIKKNPKAGPPAHAGVNLSEKAGSDFGCETAFVYGCGTREWSFLPREDGGRDINGLKELYPQLVGFNPNRWGWTNGIYYEENLGSFYLTFPIWAGAGQSDLEKGTEVGFAYVRYWMRNDKYEFEIQFHMYLKDKDNNITARYNLSEAHIYVGPEPFPKLPNGRYTVAPGHYTYSDEDFMYKPSLGQTNIPYILISDLEIEFGEDWTPGDIVWLIGQAVVCGEF